MGKYRKKIKPDETRLRPADPEEKAPLPVRENSERKDKLIAVIVFFTATCLLFILSIVFFGLDAAAARNYERSYEQIQGTVIDIETRGSGHGARLALVISYSYGGEEFVLHDGEAYGGTMEIIGKQIEIYVNRENPQIAITEGSMDNFSIAGTVLISLAAFAFVCTAGLFVLYKRER